MIISLTGFMGCGKSSVGRKLSELLCCRFMDLDSLIEQKAGRSIPEIFESEGEAEFRKMERHTLAGLLEDNNNTLVVLSLGGGTVMTAECAEMVRKNTFCIYLRASVDTLVMHLDGETANRPILSGAETLPEKIGRLMDIRSSTYEGTAHQIIDIDDMTVEEIAQAIIKTLEKR